MTRVFPQTGDPNAGELFALLLGQENTTDFVGEGLDVTVDTEADEATISAGTCYTSRDTATVAGTDNVVEDLGYVLQFDGTTVSLPHTETVLAIVPDHDAIDSISIGTYQFVDDIPDSGLHIATVNRDSGDVELYNRDPHITAADLTVSSSATVDGPLSVSDDTSLSGSLEQNGETVFTQEGEFVISGIKNSQLANNSLSVSAGGDLSGGGEVSLGETVSLSVETTDRYTDTEAIDALNSEVSVAASSVSALDSQVSTNESTISSLDTDKLDSDDYNPEQDTHDRYTDSEAVSAVDGEVSTAATSVSGLDALVDSNESDISSLASNKLDSDDYNPEVDTHDRYSDSEAVSAVDSNVSDAATSVSGLDSQVSTNTESISSLESNKLDSVDYTPESDTHDRYTDAEAVSAADGEVSDAAMSVSGLDTQVSSNTSSISSNESDISTNAADLSDHESAPTGVHGVGDADVESTDGAQSKADTAQDNAESYADDQVADHESSGEHSQIDGDVVDRVEPIESLSGNIYVTEEGADDPTQNDGDLWFEYEVTE